MRYAECLQREMIYQARGIFVGDEKRTFQNFGDGHAIISKAAVSYRSKKPFKAFQKLFPSSLRIVVWPAAPQLP